MLVREIINKSSFFSPFLFIFLKRHSRIERSLQPAFNIVPQQLARYDAHLGKHAAHSSLPRTLTDEDHWLWQTPFVCYRRRSLPPGPAGLTSNRGSISLRCTVHQRTPGGRPIQRAQATNPRSARRGVLAVGPCPSRLPSL